MLELQVRFDDTGKPWELLDGRWFAGDGWLAPFSYPVIGSAAATDGGRTAIVVRERTGPDCARLTTMDPGGYERWVQDVLQHPLDFVLIELLPGKVVLRAGIWGAAPVYVASDRSGVRASWRLTEVAVGTGAADVDEALAVQHLGRAHRYTRAPCSHPCAG